MGSLHLEVQFYGLTEAAVVLPMPDESVLGKAAELKLLSFYGGHVLADLGRDYYSEELVKWVKHGAWPGEQWLSEPFAWDTESLGDRAIGEVRLVDQRSARAKPRFEAALAYPSAFDSSFFDLASQSDWRLKLRGVMFSGNDARSQLAASFPMLLHTLHERRGGDKEQQRRLLATTRALCFAFTVGELCLPAHWAKVAAEVARYGWDSSRPPFLTLLSLNEFRPLDLPDDLWHESQLEAGHRFFGEITDDQLPFTDIEGDEWAKQLDA